jgi:threonine dehydratase
VALGRTEVHLELETRGPEHIEQILDRLKVAGYGAEVEK